MLEIYTSIIAYEIIWWHTETHYVGIAYILRNWICGIVISYGTWPYWIIIEWNLMTILNPNKEIRQSLFRGLRNSQNK